MRPHLQPADLEQAFTLYRIARLLHAAAELDIAGCLVDGPRDANALAAQTQTHAPSLASVLDALACWGVFDRDDAGRYALNATSRRLVAGSDGAANVPFLLGWAGWPGTYDAFGNLMHTLRTGRSALGPDGNTFADYLAANPGARGQYERAMAATTEGFRACAAAYDFSAANTLVDVGGGTGAFCVEILQRNPHLRAICYDVPGVIANAASAGRQHDRLELVAGDAMSHVPAGADLYITSTVLRCFDDAACLRLLRSIRAAMKDTARLAAFEMVLPERRDDAALCMADVVARTVYGGSDRGGREFRELFDAAGLRLTRVLPTGGMISVLEAQPAA